MRTIGILKESQSSENRVAIAPQSLKKLLKKGYTILVERGAGLRANYHDKEYEATGAEIVDQIMVYKRAQILLKVQALTEDELENITRGQLVLSYLNPAQNLELLNSYATKGLNAIAMDAIPRISRAQKMDVLSSMANIAGYRSVIEGSNYFGRFLNGQITAAGKVNPAKVLVIGAGVAGLAAIGTAKSLGAIVRAFDTRKEVAEQIESMGGEFLTVDLEEDGATDSGYSKVMSKEFIDAEMALFLEQAKDVDLIITTARIPGRKAPELILDYHVAAMKPGSVIVDLAADTGGNCTLTKNGEVYTTENGVTIVGKIDQLATQASELYGNNLINLIDEFGSADDFQINMEDEVTSRAMVVYDGKVNWPQKPLPVSVKKPMTNNESKQELIVNHTKQKKNKGIGRLISLVGIAGFLFLMGQYAPKEFMQHFTVFVLAVFVGWQVIWNVKHALHTPLMAVTNAISGIIIIGGLLLVTKDLTSPLSILALIAIFVASINIVGGFLVTHRMLKMFRK